MSALPTFVAAGTVANNTTAIAPGLPAGIRTGDILIMFVETSSQAITAAGWTEAGSSPQDEATDTTRLTVFWCRYNENNVVGTTTSDSGDHQVGRILAFRGCVAQGNPFDNTSGSVDTTSSTSATVPGVTTTKNNCMLVYACGVSTDLASTTNFSAWADASLGSVTERTDNIVTTGTGGGFGTATGTLATAGASGSMTLTLANAARKSYWCGALKPAEAASTLSDNFDDNSKNANLWGGYQDTNVVVTETTGLVNIALTTAASGQYGVYEALGFYDLTGDSFICQVKNAGNQALQTDCIALQLDLDSANKIFWNISGGTLSAIKTVAGVDANVRADTSYNSAVHKWLRIRESAGTTYWDYSTDGKTWTNYTSAANPIAVTSLCAKIVAGAWGTSSTTTMQFDNFNCYTPNTKVLNVNQAVNRAGTY